MHDLGQVDGEYKGAVNKRQQTPWQILLNCQEDETERSGTKTNASTTERPQGSVPAKVGGIGRMLNRMLNKGEQARVSLLEKIALSTSLSS